MRQAANPIRPQQSINGFGEEDRSAKGGGTSVGKSVEAEARAQEEIGGDNGKKDDMAMQDGPEEDIEKCQEVQTPRVAADPGQPTAAARALHDMLHMPFRTWCYDCLQGQGKERYHLRI